MTFKEKLEESKGRASVVLHQIRIRFNVQDRSTLFLLFEGKDDISFYYDHIPRYLNNDYTLVRHACEGKAHVVSVFEGVRKLKYPENRFLFFIDRDLDDFRGISHKADNIYVTDYYSFENFFVTDQMLKRLITEFIQPESSQENHAISSLLEAMQNKFSTSLSQFYIFIINVMAIKLHLLRQGVKVELKHFILGKLLSIDNNLNLKKKHSDFGSLIQYFVRTTKVDPIVIPEQVLEPVVQELAAAPNPKLYARGKFELWFFVEFFNHLPRFIKEHHKTVRFVPDCAISHEDASKMLSPRLNTPDSLVIFFQQRAMALL